MYRPRALSSIAALVLLSAACGESTSPLHVTVSVTPDRSALAPGETVQLRVAATNRSGRRVAFSGSSTGTLWVQVLDGSGRPIADLRGYTDDLRHWDLAPGGSAAFLWNWDATTGTGRSPLPPGQYRAVGWLDAREVRRASAPTPITVTSEPR